MNTNEGDARLSPVDSGLFAIDARKKPGKFPCAGRWPPSLDVAVRHEAKRRAKSRKLASQRFMIIR